MINKCITYEGKICTLAKKDTIAQGMHYLLNVCFFSAHTYNVTLKESCIELNIEVSNTQQKESLIVNKQKKRLMFSLN